MAYLKTHQLSENKDYIQHRQNILDSIKMGSVVIYVNFKNGEIIEEVCTFFYQ